MTHNQNSKNNCFPRSLDIPPLSSIAIKCLSDQDIWVEQWPIIEPNLSTLKNLLTKQLELGHTEPSARRNNTPIFEIPRELGKYQLLEDLWAINAQMEKMGSLQNSLPHPSATAHHIVILNIEGFFLQIPLDAQDIDCFAFTVWKPNMHKPAQRFQWIILP